MLVASFVLPVVIIIMLINFVAWDSKPAAGSDGLTAEAVARRIQPVGVSDYKDVTDVKSMKTGEQVFQAQCTASTPVARWVRPSSATKQRGLRASRPATTH